jgi:hypothetical protein
MKSRMFPLPLHAPRDRYTLTLARPSTAARMPASTGAQSGIRQFGRHQTTPAAPTPTSSTVGIAFNPYGRSG